MKKEGAIENKKVRKTRVRQVKKSDSGKPPRLYLRAVFTGFRRGKTTQNERQTLLKIEGVNDRKEVPYYQGKRVVYVYKTKKGIKVNKRLNIQSIWGRIMKCHGNNGVVRARFAKNLPPKAMGSTLRVMLYPQRPTI